MEDIFISVIIALLITGLLYFVFSKWLENAVSKAVLEEQKEQWEHESELNKKIAIRRNDGVNDGAARLLKRLRKEDNN